MEKPKRIRFKGDSLKQIKAFPPDARRETGYQLDLVQQGLDPTDWKPMPSIGKGVREIRVSDGGNAFRTIYIAKF